jgi:hypothetical protein
MTERILTVAANGYTRDHIPLAINKSRTCAADWQPLVTVNEIEIDGHIFRFVTDNEMWDGEFRVVGEE